MLADDALRSDGTGGRLLVGLPWIRSLPLSSVSGLEVVVDDAPVDATVVLGDERHDPERLPAEVWWFLQDRLVVQWDGPLSPGEHRVRVRFSLRIPYLAPGGRALVVPVEDERRLVVDADAAAPLATREVA